MAACQQFNWSWEGTLQLTLWKGFYESMSVVQVEPRRHTATHPLEGIFHSSMLAIQVEPRRHEATHQLKQISWQHISNSTGDHKAHSNSPSVGNFMAAY